MSSPPTRAPRRDALRNRERVLAAAERVFAERGLDAHLEEVAAAAGVGVGTVCRRFASKAALTQAVFERRVETGVRLLAECRRLPSAWEGLCEYLRRSLVQHSDDRGLHEFIYAMEGNQAAFDQLRARIEPPLAELIERAQGEGALRADFRATDVPPLVLMLSRLAHTDRRLGPPLARRYLELIIRGLGPDDTQYPVEPALDAEALGDWLTALRG